MIRKGVFQKSDKGKNHGWFDHQSTDSQYVPFKRFYIKPESNLRRNDWLLKQLLNFGKVGISCALSDRRRTSLLNKRWGAKTWGLKIQGGYPMSNLHDFIMMQIKLQRIWDKDARAMIVLEFRNLSNQSNAMFRMASVICVVVRIGVKVRVGNGYAIDKV